MKCIKFERLMSDFIDGELTEKRSALLRDHLSNCNRCRKLFDDYKKMLDGARSLETVEPGSDIWPQIEICLSDQLSSRLRNTPASPSSGFSVFRKACYGVAAAMILIVAIMLLRHESPQKSYLIKSEQLHLTAMKRIAEAERSYQKAIEALNRVVDARRESLDPALAAVLEKNIALIDDSIRVCREAIKERPGDLEVRKYLLVCYRRKVDLLNEIRTISPLSG